MHKGHPRSYPESPNNKRRQAVRQTSIDDVSGKLSHMVDGIHTIIDEGVDRL